VHEWHSRKSWALCRASNFPSTQLFIQKGKGADEGADTRGILRTGSRSLKLLA